MLEVVRSAAIETVGVGAVIALMMIVVEAINVPLRGALPRLLGHGRALGFIAAAILGVIPGCAGGYLAVTLYGHGALSFGALVTTMVATSGDEALFMIGRFPREAALLFGLMALTALIVGALTDLAMKRLGLAVDRDCDADAYHPGHESLRHFLEEHVVRHVLGRHLPRILAWTFAALFVSGLVASWLGEHGSGEGWSGPGYVLLAAAWGLIPTSGPHMIFAELYAEGLLAWPVLVANSLSQSGHDILPLLAISWKDAAWTKGIALAAAIAVGLLLGLASP